MRHSKRGFTLIEVLVVVAIISILASLVLVAVQNSRLAAYRAACMNNLNQLGRGFALHESAYGSFPPRVPSLGNSPGSTCTYEWIGWPVYILPFIEQGRLFDQIQQAYEQNPEPYPDPTDPKAANHVANARSVLSILVCPQDARLLSLQPDPNGIQAGYLSYLGVTGCANDFKAGMFGNPQGVTAAQISDGLSNTLMLGERPPPASFEMGWWYTAHQCSVPQAINDFEGAVDSGGTIGMNSCGGPSLPIPDRDFFVTEYFRKGDLATPCDRFHYWSLHPNGGNFLFADGSVKFLTYQSPLMLRKLATIHRND